MDKCPICKKSDALVVLENIKEYTQQKNLTYRKTGELKMNAVSCGGCNKLIGEMYKGHVYTFHELQHDCSYQKFTEEDVKKFNELVHPIDELFWGDVAHLNTLKIVGEANKDVDGTRRDNWRLNTKMAVHELFHGKSCFKKVKK